MTSNLDDNMSENNIVAYIPKKSRKWELVWVKQCFDHIFNSNFKSYRYIIK